MRNRNKWVIERTHEKRSKEDLLCWVGSSYSRTLGVSYKRATRQEAWDVYLEDGVIVFSDNSRLDDAEFLFEITKKAYHKMGFDSRDYSFRDLCLQMREQMTETIGPGHELVISIEIR